MPHEAPSISQDQQNKISPVLLPSQVYVFEGPTRRNFWFSWRHSFSKFTIYTYLQFLHVIVSHLLPLHAWTGSWYCVVWETNVEGSRVKVFIFFFLSCSKRCLYFWYPQYLPQQASELKSFLLWVGKRSAVNCYGPLCGDSLHFSLALSALMSAHP